MGLHGVARAILTVPDPGDVLIDVLEVVIVVDDVGRRVAPQLGRLYALPVRRRPPRLNLGRRVRPLGLEELLGDPASDNLVGLALAKIANQPPELGLLET